MKTLKKFIAALALVATVLGPNAALATTVVPGNDIQTSFTINSTTSVDPVTPIIKAVWEEEPTVNELESGDPTHCVNQTQVLPPLQWGANKNVTVCTVVTDPQTYTDLVSVKAKVTGPNLYHYCSPNQEKGVYVLSKAYDPTNRTQVTNALARFEAASSKGLVSYNDTYDYADVVLELEDTAAAIYCGEFPMNYEDPAGAYNVLIDAWDKNSNYAEFGNNMTYVAVGGFETDFTAVNYGAITTLGQEQIVSGDRGPGAWGTANKPTVRNIGNVRLNMTVNQDLMGLRDVTPSIITYAARLGDYLNTKKSYLPNVSQKLPDVLETSTEEKMDFWVTISEPNAGQSSYTGHLLLGAVVATPQNNPCTTR